MGIATEILHAYLSEAGKLTYNIQIPEDRYRKYDFRPVQRDKRLLADTKKECQILIYQYILTNMNKKYVQIRILRLNIL
jgi:hypothetical protein